MELFKHIKVKHELRLTKYRFCFVPIFTLARVFVTDEIFLTYNSLVKVKKDG